MPSKLYNLFGERITFKQSNPDRYMDIVGRGAIEIDDIAGRGYIRVGRRPLLYHAALPVGICDQEDGRDTLTEADELRLMASNMSTHLQASKKPWRNQPDPIKILPEIVPLVDVLERVGEPTRRRIQAVLGRNISLQPAQFDLKRMGPHFTVVGPPLSGKTTVLYNWVLSLSQRYDPDQVMLVLVDFQQRFVDYGGEHKLDDLPHVVTAITEFEQLEGMVANLKSECEVLASDESDRELFVIIDNFDDFSEEIERMRDIPRDLAGLARRYGRDGLHFVIGGTLDSGVSELRRRVQSANYGIGLRSAQAVDTLRVTRRPAALRGKELPPGRGFIVKSGQPTMIQVATPYDGVGATASGSDIDDEESKIAEALDIWVKKIQALHPEKRATWSQPIAALAADGEAVVVDAETKPIIDLLKRVIFKQADGDQEEIAAWDDKAVLLKFVKDALGLESGLDPSFFGTSIDEVLDAAAGYFPEISGNGAEEAEEAEAEKQ